MNWYVISSPSFLVQTALTLLKRCKQVNGYMSCISYILHRDFLKRGISPLMPALTIVIFWMNGNIFEKICHFMSPMTESKTKMMKTFYWCVTFFCLCTLGDVRAPKVELYLTNCQLAYVSGDTVELQAFLNTSGTNQTEWPLDNIVLLTLMYFPECTVNITNDGCELKNTSLCGYCDRQVEDGYFINFTITFDINIRNYWFFCYWYGIDNKYVQDNVITSSLQYDSFQNKRYFIGWDTEAFFILNNQTNSPELQNVQHFVGGNYQLQKNLFLGTTAKIFPNMNQSADSILSPLILLSGADGSCQYECQSVAEMLNLQNLVISIYESNEISNVTLYNISKSITAFLAVMTYDLPQVVYLEKLDYNDELQSITFKFRNLFGLHRFSLYFAYNVSTCVNANVWNLYQPNITLADDCPSGPYVKNGLIRRGTNATCRCLLAHSIFPFSSVQWLDSSGQPISTSGAYSDLLILTAGKTQYTCTATIFERSTSGLTFIPNYFDVPRVVNFTANGKKSADLSVGDNVTISCQVQSEPEGKAVLLASGLGSIKEIISTNGTLEISLHDLQCEDSGRYNCTGRNGFEDNVTSYPDYVDINIKCIFQLNQQKNTSLVTTVSPDENSVFTFEVYGYPEPTEYVLKIETGKTYSTVETNQYKVSYTRLTPPFGLITVTVFDNDRRGLITYVLNVKNEAGEITLTIQVNKEMPPVNISSDSNSADVIERTDCTHSKHIRKDVPISGRKQVHEHKDEENVYNTPLEDTVEPPESTKKYTSLDNAVLQQDSNTNKTFASENELDLSDYNDYKFTNPVKNLVTSPDFDKRYLSIVNNDQSNPEPENDYSNIPADDTVALEDLLPSLDYGIDYYDTLEKKNVPRRNDADPGLYETYDVLVSPEYYDHNYSTPINKSVASPDFVYTNNRAFN
ncbi:cell adhesion molecule 3 [Biomphalaria glabrata]